jgi:ABC-type multidrug transport system fused ATPase/permease subunit
MKRRDRLSRIGIVAPLQRAQAATFAGSLLSRITADTELLRDAATTNVSILLRSTANALIGVGMMFWTSWRLTLLALGVTPAVVLFVAHFGRALRQLSKETRAAAAEASSLAGDTLGAIRSVKAFARERAEASLFEVSVQKTLQLGLTTAQRGALFMAFATSVMVSVIATVFWYGGTLVISGRMTVGSLQAFVLYAVAIAGAIGGLSGVVVSLMTAVGASSRVFELLDRVPELAPCGALRPFDGRTCFSAELVDVWFAYPSRPDAWVLRGICILVEEGKTFALCGASGCGKSTIAALIERFYDPQKGTVLLAGVPAQQIETVHLHRALGIVSQEPLLLARSIRDNIAFGVDNATDEEVAAAAAAANASSFIEAYDTKYDTQVGERGVQLSGGQKQRIAIARALLTKPLTLLLDEATSALDAESEAAVVDALERARKGRTALIIAHRLSTVRDADCIAVIGGGVVEEKGVHDALLAQGGTYARLVQRQLASADNLLAELPAAEQSATS